MESQQAEGTVRTRLDDTTALDRTGCLVLNQRGTTAEKHEGELKTLKNSFTRFS